MKTQNKFQREKPLFRDKPEYKCIGYARQSTNKQISIVAQVEELKKAGCVVVFQATVSNTIISIKIVKYARMSNN